MTRHNVNKSPAIRAVMSLAMATFMFLSSGFGTSVAHAEEKIVSYKYKTSEPGSISEFKKLAEEGKDLSGKTVIISTNDVHGAIQKYPYVASLKNFFKNDLHSDVILVDSGDFSQDKKEKGNPGADSAGCMEKSKGLAGVLAMNAVGYDLATLGNHEFEYGFDAYSKNAPEAKFKLINSNILKEDVSKTLKDKGKKGTLSLEDFKSIGSEQYLCDANYLYESPSSDLKIGFFGLLAPEASTKSSNYKILKDKVLYTCAQNQADELRKQGANIVICLSHLGLEDSVTDNRSIDIYTNLSDGDSNPVDLILDAHSHTLFFSGAKDEPIMSGEMLLRNVGITIIDNESKTIDKRIIVPLNDLKANLDPDKGTEEAINVIINEYNPDFFNQATGEASEAESKSNENAGKSDNKKKHKNNYRYSFG